MSVASAKRLPDRGERFWGSVLETAATVHVSRPLTLQICPGWCLRIRYKAHWHYNFLQLSHMAAFQTPSRCSGMSIVGDLL